MAGSKVVYLKVMCGSLIRSHLLVWMAGSKEVILKGSVVQLSHFTKFRAVVSSTVSYSGHLGFEQMSIGDFPDELFDGFLQYAKKILGLSSNRP
jgi:hypothetical protein